MVDRCLYWKSAGLAVLHDLRILGAAYFDAIVNQIESAITSDGK